jgi:tRNA modification GTPase
MFTLDDTIAAVASAAGGAARGIVRLSGPQVAEIVPRCFQPDDAALDWKRIIQATVIPGRVICHCSNGQAANQRPLELPADVFLWPTRRSYTRQPLAEIHTIGSPPLLQAVLNTLCSAGARLAQPGEFTLRAFLAGRIDLMQAEAVLGVVDAADRRHLHAALEQLAGGLSRPLQQLRSDLLDLLADLEAGLDFVEDDIRFVAPGELENRLSRAAAQLEHIQGQLADRNAGADLPRVVLVGWPNVGKSSLFNALVGNAAALVSPQAGTTRDYLIATIDAGGLSVQLIDTAGIIAEGGTREADEELLTDLSGNAAQRPSMSETLVAAAQAALAHQQRQADLRLLCLDATRPLNDWERVQLSCDDASHGTNGTLVVMTKCDHITKLALKVPAMHTSSRTGVGLNNLRAAIREALTAQTGEASVVASTAARVRESIRLATESLSRAHQLVVPQALHQTAEELVAAELRAALAELGKVVGAVYTDDLLDRIFSRFCIGK